MKFKNLKIAQKLFVSFFLITAIFMSSSYYKLVQQSKLGKLQDEGAIRADGLVFTTEISAMPYKLYQVIADGIIKRNLPETELNWKSVKSNTNNDLLNLEKIIETDFQKEQLKIVKKDFDDFYNIFENEMLPILKADSSIVAVQEIDAKLEAEFNNINIPLKKILDSINIENKEADKLFDETIKNSNFVSVILNVLTVAFLIILAFFLVKIISNPLKKALAFVLEISKGNLMVNLDIDQKDEVGQLSKALGNMVKKLRTITSEIMIGAQSISSASFQISSSSQEMSQGANEQASSVEEVSSSIEEMAATIQQNTNNAVETNKIATKSSIDIQTGSNAVNETVISMKSIAEKVSIITEIAYQTNLLALNAAVEAARVGELGAGFAVVAAEVRKLAERSQSAAKEIESLAKSSVEVAENTGNLFESIVPSIQNTANLVSEISDASVEQSNGLNQISSAIQQLNNVSQQNAAVSEELATSSEEMSSQAEQLQELIGFFKVENQLTKITKKNHVVKSQPKFVQQNQNPVKYTKTNVEKNTRYGIDFDLQTINDDEFQTY
jgi:methyl-accepting chemotaxis protein